MKQITEYTYLGTNGTLTSPIHLEGIYSIKKIRLIADKDKILTNGQEQKFVVAVLEDEISKWQEIDWVAEEEGQE